MKILLSAYACEPGKGSEQGVGWHWAIELARLGHDVVVITRANNRSVIEEALAGTAIEGLEFQYFDLPTWAKGWKRGARGVHLYYWLWQYGAYRHARRLVAAREFDVVHHLTFGVFRQPSFMGRLGLPFVVGPVGGGELAPQLLRRGLTRRDKLKETIRDASNRCAVWDPFVRAMLGNATLIFCKTEETRAALPGGSQAKCRVHLEIGLEPERMSPATADRRARDQRAQDRRAQDQTAPCDFLYAGRVIYWKGIHLALRALAQMESDAASATLTIIGTGPEESRLKALIARLGIKDKVRWLGWVSHEDLWEHYGRYTALVFPSLHDSSGNVILEAMSQALPVICLDTGGPAAVVPGCCGLKVRAKNRSEADVVMDLAAAMQLLAENPQGSMELGQRAQEYARGRTWKDVVQSAYEEVESALSYSVLPGRLEATR